MNISSSIPSTYSSQAYTPCIGSRKDDTTDKSFLKQGSAATASSEQLLSVEEKQQVQELQKRDQEVKVHEMAHIAAGGQYVRGGPHYSYQTGPDGKRYAVGGEVSIDTSEVSDDPDATIRKMQIVKKAALAPAQPSAQDRSIAATANQKEAQAHQEKLSQQPGSFKETSPEKDTNASEKKTILYTRDARRVSAEDGLSRGSFRVTA